MAEHWVDSKGTSSAAPTAASMAEKTEVPWDYVTVVRLGSMKAAM